MAQIQSLLQLFFGPSWRTSLIGYVGLGLTAASVKLELIEDPKLKTAALIASVVFAAFARVAKDAAVSGVPAPDVQPKGFTRLGTLPLLVLLSLTACAGFSALSGSTGPIPVAEATNSAGQKVPSATVNVTAKPTTGAPPQCVKPVSISADAGTGFAPWHQQCDLQIPVPPVNGACP